MKYLLTILAIILSIIVASYGLHTFSVPPPVSDIVAMVNKSVITSDALQLLQKNDSNQTISKSRDAIEQLITRELLLQEAHNLNIDESESFRTALKNFYEQTLITQLLEQQKKSFEGNIHEAEITQYITLLGSTVTFSQFGYNQNPSKNNDTGNKKTVLFDTLPDKLKATLSLIRPSQTVIQYDGDNRQSLLRLDSVKNSGKTIIESVERRAEIRTLLSEHSKKRQVAEWLAGLRKDASITIYDKQEQP